MFRPKTDKIKILSEFYPEVIKELEDVFKDKTNVYIDFANVLGWQDRLMWYIDLRRLKQLLDSFDTINDIKFYYGILKGDSHSENIKHDVEKYGYNLKTKPVKILRLSIDVSSIPANSPTLLEGFIRKPLLSKFNLETVEYLNNALKKLNGQGIKYIEDKKCNFDVELGRDMLLDYKEKDVKNFNLWSGDSDFADPIKQLIENDKRVIIFCTARRLSSELNEIGARVFEIKKIKEFICWQKDLPQELNDRIKSQKDSRKSP